MTGKFYRSSKISINFRFKSLQKATVVLENDQVNLG